MDSSPETNKLAVSSSSSSHSPAVQESPFFNYLRTLSPIKPAKATAHVSQVFPELSIPPPAPVFTSPRLNPQSETFLNRSKYSEADNATLPIEHKDEGHTLAAGSDVSERPMSRLTVGLTSCTQKECETRSSLQNQSCSPPELVDEYLADPIEVDSSVTSSDLADPHTNQTEDRPKASRNGDIRLKETTLKVDADSDNTLRHMEIGSDVQIESLDQSKEGLQQKSLAFIEPGKMKIGEVQSLETSDVLSEKINDVGLSESSPKLLLGEKKAPYVETQSAEGEQDGKGDTYVEELPGKLQIDELAGVPSHASVVDKGLEDAGQQQRGTRRRCLQFESSAAHTKFSTSNHASTNLASISRCLSVPTVSTNLEMLDSPQLDVMTSRNNCTVSSSQSMPCKSSLFTANTGEALVDNFDRSVRKVGNSSKKIPVPSGIGLHLNSIVNTAAMGCTRSSLTRPEESRSSSLPSTVIGNVSAKSRSNQLESEHTVAEGPLASHFFCDNADKIQEFNQQSPRYKRKRTDFSEDEGCKRCNCRRSKCLKLYCECFAAGIYCAEPCACHECFNKPGYEDMVLETRRQIQLRNPLAFVPKVVSHVTDSPANSGEENNKVTPSSARHKRGCNCKKSMCLKKYCECFQSGVGCSVGCRCDGCKNTFGVKEGYGQFSAMVSRKVDGEIWEDLSDGKVVMETRSKLLQPELGRPHSLTPPTPSFQCSVHRKDIPKSRFPGRRCLPSPDSDSTLLSSPAQSPSSSRNINSHEQQANMADGNLDIVFDQEMEFSTSRRMDQFSPKWDRFEDICNLTPLSQASSKASRVQLQGSIRLSGSLRWRSSPITPMPRLGENKVCQEPDLDIVSDILEDETPDILKDTHTPVKGVKVSSPNQKRITPPHNHLHNLRSSPSPGLKSGRKFVLQSISSFPSLTPYSDPKDSSTAK